MKRFFILCFILGVYLQADAQGISVNTTGAAADASAMLDISSTDKGMLVPRMTSTERQNISNPAQGLLVYDLNSRTFWFYDGGWNQITAGGGPSGSAGGDLSGSYPTPNVVKIQNLDVAFGVPFDKQVLKWDALSNNWKGRNDSLFLPYNCTYANNGAAVFGITTNSTTNGSSAIYGKRGATGSGIVPGITMGVWGDNSNGIGVVGTSNAGIGAYGLSFGNHGVYGYSALANFAGVAGSHANPGGIGVLGDIQNSGTALMGRSTSTLGKAGLFMNTNTENLDTTVLITTAGKGTLGYFNVSNAANDKAAIDIAHAGNGNGIKLRQTKTNSPANALDVLAYGNGYGIYSRSENSTAAKFENTNANNAFAVMSMGNNSLGSTLTISSTNTGVTGNVVNVTNNGQGRALSISSAKGNAGYFAITDATATATGVSIQHPGSGRGAEISLTKATNTQPGLWVSTAGTLGIQSTSSSNNSVGILGAAGATANDAVGVKGTTGTNVTNGIGVLGQAGTNDPNGIGVKGIAGGGIAGGVGVLGIANETNSQAIAVKGIGYSHNEDVGAVMGINMTDGVGVYGESQGFDGIGVVGVVGNTSNHSVAAMFKNNYASNDRAVVEIFSNGQGNGILLDHTSLTNNDPLFRMRNSGDGQFLRFESGLGDIKTTLSKEGNLTTDGTITVKSNKGIIRNSTSTQLRVEVVLAVWDPASPIMIDAGTSGILDVTFTTPFPSPPTVYVGNIVQNGGIEHMATTISNVTTTGCTLIFTNATNFDIAVGDSTWKLMVMGTE